MERDDHQRLTDLEIKVAFQDRVIAQLDEVVREFAERVEVLERAVKSLHQSAQEPVGASDEKPPHY